MTLAADITQTLEQFREHYEHQRMQRFNCGEYTVPSLNYDFNEYYFEVTLQEFSKEEIIDNFSTEIVDELIKRHRIRSGSIEYCRAVDAVKLLRDYLIHERDRNT